MKAAATALALLSLAFVWPFAQAPAGRAIHRHFDPRDRDTGRYQYVPFDVSPGTEAVTISYAYNSNDGANVIDLGLFEPGPLTLGTAGFRGYSGGAQRTITVGRNNASPGYKIGSLPAGTWHAMLGMYKVAPGGVDVQVRITEAREDPATPGPTGPGLRASEGAPAPVEDSTTPVGRVFSDPPRWYAGALHLHTIHSDGALTPAALAEAARNAGYDFIAITDHNNTTHARDPLPSSPLHIVGEEVTTPAGHANMWGLPDGAWIDFRVSPNEPGAAEQINSLVTAVHRAGALFSISHPIDNCAGCSWEQVIPDGIDAVEIWQNEKAPRAGEIAFWDRLLRAGRHVTAVGVADWHRLPARIDMAASRVLAGSLTQPAILDGIRAGHVIVMRDARTEPPFFGASCRSSRAGAGDSIVCAARDSIAVDVSMPAFAEGRAELLWNGDVADSKRIGDGASFSVPAARGYLRVHLLAADGSTVAITNPVYVEIR